MNKLVRADVDTESPKLGYQIASVTLEGIEAFVGVTDEREAHLSFLLVRHGTSLSTVKGASVFLGNLINREVRHVDVGAESRLKRSADVTKLFPDHATEERVALDLHSTCMLSTFSANAVFGVTEEASNVSHLSFPNQQSDIPSNERLRFTRQCEFLREVKTISPVHNLAVDVGGFLGAERRPAHKTFEHDGANRPPVTQIGVALSIEDLGSNVVRGTNCRVSHSPTRFTPGVDLSTIRNSQVDGIVEVSRVAVSIPGGRVLQEVLVVCIVVGLLPTGGKAEVSKLDVTTAIEKNVVRFDITSSCQSGSGRYMRMNSPMEEAKLVDSFDSHDNLCHVEPGDILREDLILDEHGHQVTTRQELHEQIEVCVILE